MEADVGGLTGAGKHGRNSGNTTWPRQWAFKNTVSKLSKDLDMRANKFLNRPLTGECPQSGWMPPV